MPMMAVTTTMVMVMIVMAVAMMKKEQTRQLSLPLKKRLQNQSPLMFETNEMVH